MMEFKVEGRESGGSQVSVRASRSRELSEMNSWRTAGLFNSEVMTEADRILR